MNESVFVSYRQEDSGPRAQLLAKALDDALPSQKVFFDLTSIAIGATWPERIHSALKQSRYVLVVIGPRWLLVGMNEWGQRRIDDPADWVRQEVANALKDNDKTIIPVLVDGAKMPPREALPADMAPLTTKQYIQLREAYWDHDVERLASRLSHGGSVDTRSIPPNPLFDQIWDRLSAEMQDAMTLAANEARRRRKTIISTKDVFAAFLRLNPDRLSEFFETIPSEALPEPVPVDVPLDVSAISGIQLLSDCVQDSLNHLTPKSSPTDRLSTEDLFVDIARHGTGASVRQLRTNGVSVDRINEIVCQLGWTVLER